tara:strand:- start:4423 stop:4590 length:168 start_codon:yes stop_codon:yes gene_type:complete
LDKLSILEVKFCVVLEIKLEVLSKREDGFIYEPVDGAGTDEMVGAVGIGGLYIGG